MTARQIIKKLKSKNTLSWIAKKAIPTVFFPGTLFFLTFSFFTQTIQAQQGPDFASGASETFPLKAFSTPDSGKSAKTSKGIPFSEILRGNGSQLGYQLSHGNIQTDTLSVHVGATRLTLNKEYWLDAGSGTLYFASPIRSAESVSAYYRYEEGASSASQKGVYSGLQFAMGGQSFNLGLTYNTLASDGTGMQTSLYGLALGGKTGRSGNLAYNGLAYFTNTQASSNLVTSTHLTSEDPKAVDKAALGADHLLVQDLALNSSGFKLRADYQDVGKNFSGFQALKAGSANDKTMQDRLATLEGEKGVKRLGFGLGYSGSPKNKSAGGLNLDWNQIQDGKGSIQQESLSYTSQSLNLNYSERSVSEAFEKFAGLRESEKAQWQKEKGLKTSTLGLGFNFANGKNSTGALGFSSQNYSDKSGSFKRELIGLTSGKFGFTLLNRKSDLGFKRLTDLSDADKTNLALDLYRQFDPNAKAEQVTANDKLQVVKESGFSREAARLDAGLGKSGQFAYSQMSVSETKKTGETETTDGIHRESLNLHSQGFTLGYVSRKIGDNFSRIADLSDIEKNSFALDIKRQFDPNAKLEQVTQKDRDLLAKETGLERRNLIAGLNFGKKGNESAFTISSFQLSEQVLKKDKVEAASKQGIEGTRFNYASKTLQATYASQSISNRFTRLADLTDLERSQFGKANGLQSEQLHLTWQTNKTTKIQFSRSNFSGTGDAIQDAILDASKNKQDASKAASIAGSALSRLAFSLETTGLSFSAKQGETDRDFKRSGDLALADPEKQQIESERGMKRSDYALHLDRIKGLTFDGTLYSANDAEQQKSHNVEHMNLQFAPSKKTQLSYKSDGDISEDKGVKAGNAHSNLTLAQELQKGFFFHLLHDETADYEKGVQAQGSTTDFVSFETPKTAKNNLSVDSKRVTFLDGKYENTTNLNVNAMPSPKLSVSFSRQEIARGEAPKKDAPEAKNEDDVQTPGSLAVTTTALDKSRVEENTDSVDFQWQATKQFAVVFGLSQKDTTNKTDGDTVSVGLQGEPIKHFTLSCKFNEVHNDGKNTKDVADFSISNSKPIQFGAIQDLTITARYASLNDQRKLQNETMTGRAAWKIHKNEFLLDYGGFTKPNGESTTYRLYQFTTDPNPKKHFHGGFLYKVKSLADGQERTIKRFTADWKLNKHFDFVYAFGTMPEDEQGNLRPLTTENVGLKHNLRPGLTAEYFYRLSDDQVTKKLTRSLGFGLEGALDKITKLSIAYSSDAVGSATLYDRSNHYRLLFDRQVNADHFLTVSTEFRSHDGKDLKDEIRANVDYRLSF